MKHAHLVSMGIAASFAAVGIPDWFTPYDKLNLPALYALYAAWKGEVYAKSGVWGKVVSRGDSPSYFWIAHTGVGAKLFIVD
jgi:hypothetical protein